MERQLARGELLVGVGVVALGLLVVWQTTGIPERLLMPVGPRAAPYAVGGALIVLGLLLCVEAGRGGWRHTLEEDDEPPHYKALGWLIAGLLVNVLLIGGLVDVPLIGALAARIPTADGTWSSALVNEGLGFVPASGLQFLLVARAFGSRNLLRNTGIALAVTVVALFTFARGFSVNIGRGVVDAWLLRLFDAAAAAVGFGG